LLPRRPDSKPACGLHTYSLPDWNAYTDSDGDTNGNAHGYTNSYGDSYANGDTNSDSYAYA
jgi:hypothetical protein